MDISYKNMIVRCQGERIFVESPRGLTADEASVLYQQLPGFIARLKCTDQERLEWAIDEAKTVGNQPLVEMLTASYKELYPPCTKAPATTTSEGPAKNTSVPKSPTTKSGRETST